MKKKPNPVALPTLQPMSATLLTFAKPLLEHLEEPPTAKTLQGILNIAIVVWNLPVYEEAKDTLAATLRGALESARASMPPQGKAAIAAMGQAGLPPTLGTRDWLSPRSS
jgi:hypothetical protein